MKGRRNRDAVVMGTMLLFGSRCGGGRDPTKYEAMLRWIHDHGRCSRKFMRTRICGRPSAHMLERGPRMDGRYGKQLAVGEGMSMRQLVRCWRGVGGLGDGGRDARLG